jgi:hypothetical protein
MSETDSFKLLEKRINDLEAKMNVPQKPPKPPRAPRAPSAYNKFMGEYIAKNKDPKKTHKELFGEAVKAWNEAKK